MSKNMKRPALALADALRTTTKRRGTFFLRRDGCYCALGVYAEEVLGINLIFSVKSTDEFDEVILTRNVYRTLGTQLNLDAIWRMNDLEPKITFKQMADKIEADPCSYDFEG